MQLGPQRLASLLRHNEDDGLGLDQIALVSHGLTIGLPALQRRIQPAGLGFQEGDRVVGAPAGLAAAAGIKLPKLQDADLLQLRGAGWIAHQHGVGIGGVVDQLLEPPPALPPT